MADLVKNREKFFIPTESMVEIRVTCGIDAGEETLDMVPWYQCVPCGTAMKWESGMRMWECQECGYQMTVDESDYLSSKTVEAIRKLSKSGRRKRGFWWRLSRLFVGQKSQPLISSNSSLEP